MKKNIGIIGVGQLGSRHLQSLASLNRSTFDIHIFDTDNISRETAKERYFAVSKRNSPLLFIHERFSDLPRSFFVVIIATSSEVRKNAVMDLFHQAQIKFLILEKFLFPRIQEYQEVSYLLRKHGVICYVNTPRRTFDFYKELKKVIKPPFTIQVIGSDWGLGCNSIHFLDLFYFLNNKAKIEISTYLNGPVIESKRKGYIEFTGTLLITDENKSILQMTSHPGGGMAPIITITDVNGQRVYFESLKKLVTYQISSVDFQTIHSDIEIPYQSASTSKIIKELFNTGACSLTPFKDSSYLHLKLLEIYLNHYNKTTTQQTDTCPIT